MRHLISIILVGSVIGLVTPESSAAEPGWSPVIIATGDYRKQIQATPIEQRPYRPFHFYGNTIRRMHYRGNPLPLPRGLAPTLDPSRLIRDYRLIR